MKDEYKSRVYTDRPSYADADAPDKFQAIMGIIATRLQQHPKAICSYSGGADSDIMIDLIERTREVFPSLPPVKYVFFNTGLEYPPDFQVSAKCCDYCKKQPAHRVQKDYEMIQ